jgi:hypothetical protein
MDDDAQSGANVYVSGRGLDQGPNQRLVSHGSESGAETVGFVTSGSLDPRSCSSSRASVCRRSPGTPARRAKRALSSSDLLASRAFVSGLRRSWRPRMRVSSGRGRKLRAWRCGLRRSSAADAVRTGAALARAAGEGSRRREGLRLRRGLGERPLRLPDGVARRADGAREHDRALRPADPRHDAVACRPARSGAAGQGAGRDRHSLGGSTRRSRGAWLVEA